MFDHADKLQALEMCIKCDPVGFTVLIYAYTNTMAAYTLTASCASV